MCSVSVSWVNPSKVGTSLVGSSWDKISSGAFLMSSTSSEFVGRTIHPESVATLNNPGPAWSTRLLDACKKKYPKTNYTLIAFF
jgi:hypothetical protein